MHWSHCACGCVSCRYYYRLCTAFLIANCWFRLGLQLLGSSQGSSCAFSPHSKIPTHATQSLRAHIMGLAQSVKLLFKSISAAVDVRMCMESYSFLRSHFYFEYFLVSQQGNGLCAAYFSVA